MDLNFVKNTWDQASNSLNNLWAINLYEESTSFDEKESRNIEVLEGKGVLYSPTDDLMRPYPFFDLNFTLTWKNDGKGFILKFDFPNRKEDLKFPTSNFNSLQLFDVRKVNEWNKVREVLYLKLSTETKKKVDVTELLNIISDSLFPQYSKNSNKMFDYLNYWIYEIRNLYPNI